MTPIKTPEAETAGRSDAAVSVPNVVPIRPEPEKPSGAGLDSTDCTGILTGNADIADSSVSSVYPFTDEQLAEARETGERG